MKTKNIVHTNPQNNWGIFSEDFAFFFKSIVKQSVEEVFQNKIYNDMVLDQNLTTKQLCERWNISDTTLLSWEKKGRISPIQTGGKKKLYSLKEIKEVEANGYIKNVC